MTNRPNPPSGVEWTDPVRARVLWTATTILVAITAIPIGWFGLSSLVVVDRGQVALSISKTGADLPPGTIEAPDESHKGIQKDILTEGWYLRDPYHWQTEIVPQVEVPAGKVAVKTRLHGDAIAAGEILADKGQKGIEREILKPGRYAISTLLHDVRLFDAVAVPAGHVGVVTRLSGREPKDPNRFVVERDERGTQPDTLAPGTHYLNPFAVEVFPIDLRSHRFDMAGDDTVRFLSKDGFEIQMEATVEWYIAEKRVPEVFVKFVDERIGQTRSGGDRFSHEEVIKCITEKVLLPNARALSRIEGSKHLARDFISGETRQVFQELFLKGLKEECAREGILIQTALVRRTEPPKAIADPIREREIAIRQRDKYLQELEREREQKQLAMAVKVQERMKLVKQAEADVAVAITESNRQREVALIEANRRLQVARLELTAAENQASAKRARGQAAAAVLCMKNKAEASGLMAARAAFGSGEEYARYLFLKKVAPAMKQVISNTDGPFIDVFKAFSPGRSAGATGVAK